MKHLMYGTVSALALLVAAQSGAKADATLGTSVTLTAVNAAADVLVDSTNAIDDLSFFAAAGAFQVQQNNSINSSASQNAAIDARSQIGALIVVSQMNTALSDNLDAANLAVGAAVVSVNAINNDSFDAASGEFQVQQNHAINSTTGQNMATGAISDPGGDVRANQIGTANATNADTDNRATLTEVVNSNSINDSFEGATGAFSIQQNASINSSTQQNLAVSAISAPRGLVLVGAQVSTADADISNTENRAEADLVASSNAVTPDSFLDASGVFQVQQSNSTNSTVTQNMAVSAVSAPGGAAAAGAQLSLSSLDTRVAADLAIDDLVAATNTINGSFMGAAGAFQVQQNNSINSAASQNMTVSAVSAGVVAVGVQASEADLESAVTGNIALADAVSAVNRINGGSFTGARGAFQVQQNNSINSAVSQNMAVSAITTH